MPHETEKIADRFFAAIERNDIGALDALYHDDIVIWHSYDDAYQGRAENLAVLASIHRLGAPHYRVIERLCVGDRIVQRHDLIIVAHDTAVEYRVPAAIFLTVRDKRIVTLEEFLDSRDAMAVIAAIEQVATARAEAAVIW